MRFTGDLGVQWAAAGDPSIAITPNKEGADAKGIVAFDVGGERNLKRQHLMYFRSSTLNST
jgi:hypothetical protein